ncbi:sphingomyelin phosphodiesterase [Bacterioplanoides sp.]|uniref:sphingomyelin phosphodiesterase n=1 Tax=Bacterioplanoides sp. TaxID=2066072 RepID=UPI003B5C0044
MSPVTYRLNALLLAAVASSTSMAMSETPQAPAPSDPVVTNPTPQPSGLAYADDLKLLAYNVFMLPGAVSNYGQTERAGLILQSDVIHGHDAIILNELFHNSASQVLLDGLKTQYPNQTPVMGRGYDGWDQTLGSYSSTTPEDGGVAIVSRWPIEEQIQYVYKDACAADWFSNKGFVYVRLNKNGNDYHVIGTHAQAQNSGCSDAAGVRKKQFTEMQQFIAAKNIPADEVLFIGGDFNVIKSSDEYPDMLETLRVTAPDAYAGFDTSWDPESNGMAATQYPDLPSEYLDYIFVSRDHAQPTYWHNQSLDVTSPRWSVDNYQYQELSDHYPIAGFSYADANTRTESYRTVNEPYRQVRFRNEANGAYIKIDAGDSNGWMTINGSANDAATSFNLDNWFPKNRAFCIRNDDFVQVQGNARAGSYWNWWLGGGSGNYAYYTKNNDASNKLRIRILNDDGDCLKNGDKVAFVDRSTVNGQDYYVQRWPSGSWKDYMFMWSGSVGANETFTVEMGEGQKQDWSSKLRYAQ